MVGAGGFMLSDEEIRHLSYADRAALAHRLLTTDEHDRASETETRWVLLALVAVGCAGLIPWIVYLALTLPARYKAAHWDVAWVGFDLALLALVVGVGWAAWRRRHIIVLLATALAVMLICDAWFDVVTARGGDSPISWLTAVAVELPLAALLLLLVTRIMRAGLQLARLLSGVTEPLPPLAQVPLFDLDDALSRTEVRRLLVSPRRRTARAAQADTVDASGPGGPTGSGEDRRR